MATNTITIGGNVIDLLIPKRSSPQGWSTLWDGTADGATAVINDSGLHTLTATSLDSTTVLVTRQKTSLIIVAQILTVSGTSISVGPENTIVSDSVGFNPQLESVDSGKAVFLFRKVASGDTNHLKIVAKVLSISGTSVTEGVEIVVNGSSDSPITFSMSRHLTLIGTNRLAIAYNYSNLSSHCRVLTVSGTSIAVGAVSSIYSPGLAAIDRDSGMLASNGTDSAVFVYKGPDFTTLSAKVLTFSGDSITVGASTVIQVSSVGQDTASTLVSPTLILSVSKTTSSFHATHSVISGTSIASKPLISNIGSVGSFFLGALTPVDSVSASMVYHDSTVDAVKGIGFSVIDDVLSFSPTITLYNSFGAAADINSMPLDSVKVNGNQVLMLSNGPDNYSKWVAKVLKL